jgi:hypothetical protein
MARVSFGSGKGGRPRPAPIKRAAGGRGYRPLRPQKKWYEDPGLLLGWIRLAETLAAPKGLVARGIRAAERYQKSGAIEDARAAQEADAAIASLHERAGAGDPQAMYALNPMQPPVVAEGARLPPLRYTTGAGRRGHPSHR